MKFIPIITATLLLAGCTVRAQILDSEPGVVANIPANYTEAKTGSYTLPDPLKFADGQRVTDAKTWFEKRRPEIFRLFEENQFGRAPARPAELTFDVFDRGTPAFEGKALRKQVTIYFTASRTEHFVDVLLYLPANATGPVPVLLQFNWGPNNLAVGASDPGVKIGRQWSPTEKKRLSADSAAGPARGPGRNLNVMQTLEHGIALAIFNYTDIDPDALDATAQGVRSIYFQPGQKEPAPDEWGAIAAWGWGASRIIDYFETEPKIDAKRIAISGVSRLGKTVLWMGARDERVACVIASCSGEGGAALSRRDYGETVAHLVAPTRYPYQFAQNYSKWAGKSNEAPFDAHELIALIAPRAVLLQTGTTDKWSDPYGEYLAAMAATPVFELLGKHGLDTKQMPLPGKLVGDTLSYYMHEGGHGTIPSDADLFLKFLEAHLKP